MNDPKEDLKFLSEKFQKYWLDLSDAIDDEEYKAADLLCREISVDANAMKDLIYEIKKKELVNGQS